MKTNTQYASNLQTISQDSSQELAQNLTNQDKKKQIQEQASKIDSKTMMNQYTFEFQLQITSQSSANFQIQHVLDDKKSALDDHQKLLDLLNGLDLHSIGYKGIPIQDLTKEQAQELISEDGFFGVEKTSMRLADFVIQSNDINKLKAGREGIIKGYNQAQSAWGGKLPDLSKETLDKALEKIDKKIAELGENALDKEA